MPLETAGGTRSTASYTSECVSGKREKEDTKVGGEVLISRRRFKSVREPISRRCSTRNKTLRKVFQRFVSKQVVERHH